MATTLEGSRLKNIRVTGNGLQADLREACISASFSLATSKVTELGLTFQDDHTLSIFRKGILKPGTTVTYGAWHLKSEGYELSSNKTGPVIEIKALSRFVVDLRKQQGERNWGSVDLSRWVQEQAASVGMGHVVQPGLGVREIMREKPEDGDKGKSTWDLLADLASETGVWMYESGSTLVFAKPSWIAAGGRVGRSWDLAWNHWASYTNGLTGMPHYSKDAGAEVPEVLTFSLVSPDADTARPGDMVQLSGTYAGDMRGKWIITDVDFPMKVSGPVAITCQRPIDPKIQPPKAKEEPKAGGSNSSAPSGVSNSVADRWFSQVDGKAIDIDGAYGAQCVDLAAHYVINALGGPNIRGNGKDWFSAGAATGKFTQISANAKPAKGDIACWDGTQGGGYGHVAIVIADNGQYINCMSQNPGPAHRMNISKAGLMGYLRPKG